jgi:hypothetical protein
LFKSIDVHAASGEVDRGKFLTERLQTRVDKADTMFIATSHPTKGIDVSHKGGSKGFMKLTGSNRLSFADYPGNSIFSTLGNIKIYPKVGVCIPDFDTGLLLQMSGCAYLSFDQNDANVASGGSGRIIDIEIDQWILRRMPLRPEWDPPEASIYNPPEDA